MAGRKPDYDLLALHKGLDVRSRKIGAGWKNENGSISLTLDWPAVLRGEPNLVITLFPNKREGETTTDDKETF